MIKIRRVLSLNGLVMILASLLSCGSSHNKNNQKDETVEQDIIVPEFNADSAYHYINKQAEFGPRVPNTKAHKDCGDYLAGQLEKFGAKVFNQYADLTAYDGTILKSRNIIGEYNSESKIRILLFSHWDSRPYADNDTNKNHHHTPILGVNDGASGVGVLMEIARHLQKKTPEVGIDIIFFDSEDYGTPQFYKGEDKEDTWCLGSQYWGKNTHVDGYNARFGILLDMVGAKGSTFYYEGYSKNTANSYMKKIWQTAHQLGYSKYFIKEDGGTVVDDHVYVNKLTGIPCVDIINYEPYNIHSSFGSTWHTLKDNMDIIDKNTLKAVGQTVIQVIYNEK